MINVAGIPYIGSAITDSKDTFYVKEGYLYSTVRTDVELQSMIDSYDPLPEAKAEALQRVKEASATKRLQFVTQAAGKDAEYTFKAQEAAQFGIDGSIGVFMQGRINATGDTAAEVAAIWNANTNGWKQVGAAIAGLEDKASKQIGAETNWQQCSVVADAIIAQIEAI